VAQLLSVRHLDVAMLNRAFIFVFSALLLTGCVNSYNVSKKQPFRDYVGQTIPLQRPALLVGSASIWTGGVGVPSVLSARYGLIDLDATNMGYGPISGELPIGHLVTIDSVREEAWGDSGQVTAYGHTAIPPSTNQVSFAYPWGVAMSALRRAPWERDVAR
jgi:hypothetical protein